jgi:hypothetical protein
MTELISKFIGEKYSLQRTNNILYVCEISKENVYVVLR